MMTIKQAWNAMYRIIRYNKGWNDDILVTESKVKRMLWYANRVYISCHPRSLV